MRSRPSSGQIVGARESLNGREITGFRLSLFMLMVLRGWRSVSFTYIMRFLEGKKKLPFSSMKLYLHFLIYLNLLYIYLYFFTVCFHCPNSGSARHEDCCLSFHSCNVYCVRDITFCSQRLVDRSRASCSQSFVLEEGPFIINLY